MLRESLIGAEEAYELSNTSLQHVVSAKAVSNAA